MSVKYSIAEMKNPLHPLDPPKYYARIQMQETIPLSRIAEEISWGSSLTKGDINNLVTSATEKAIAHLRDGDIVDLGDFGKFQCQLSSKGAATIDEFSHHNIRKARFQFRPGKLIRKALDNVSFEHVMTLESQREAKRRERAADAQQP